MRYLPRGIIGREGFAIEKKQTRVGIYPELERNNDGTLPSRVTINGESFEITNRNSIHQLVGGTAHDVADSLTRQMPCRRTWQEPMTRCVLR